MDVDKATLREKHQTFRYTGLKGQVWEWCRCCQQETPCDTVQLLDALEAAERSLCDLSAKADALLTEIPGCRCHEDYRRIGREDPGCPYHEIGPGVIEDLRDALGRMAHGVG